MVGESLTIEPTPSPGERLLFWFREHWVRLIPSFLTALAFSAIALIASFFILGYPPSGDPVSRHRVLVIVSTILVLVSLIIVVALLNYFLSITLVTDRRIQQIVRTVFLRDDHRSIEISAIQEIDKKQAGLLRAILGYGDLVLRAENTIATIAAVPRVDDVYNALMNLQGQPGPHQ